LGERKKVLWIEIRIGFLERKKLSHCILIKVHHSSLVVSFFASLGGQSQSDSVAVGFSQDNSDLVNGVGSIFEFGHIEAFLFNNVSAFDFGDGDLLGHAVLDGFGDGDLDGHVQGNGDKGDSVGLSLVLLATVLVFSSSVMVTVSGGTAGGHLHGLGFGLISHLGGGSRHGFFLLDIVIGTDFTGNNGVGLLADSSDLIVTVVVVHDVLHVQDNGGGLGGEGGDADLSVDAGVGVSAVVFGAITIRRGGVVGKGQKGQKSQDKGLHGDLDETQVFTGWILLIQ